MYWYSQKSIVASTEDDRARGTIETCRTRLFKETVVVEKTRFQAKVVLS